MKSTKRIISIICSGLVVFSLLCILDYVNILNMLGLNGCNFNYDVMEIGINTVVVICLAAITYECLDKRNAEKLENQKASVNIILKQIYANMYKNLDALEDTKHLHELGRLHEKYGSEWLDKKTHLPFANENLLCEFMKDGSLHGKQFIEYQEIKTRYIDCYWGSIAFHNFEAALKRERQELLQRIVALAEGNKTINILKDTEDIEN